MIIVIEFYLINLSYSYDLRIFMYMDIYLFFTQILCVKIHSLFNSVYLFFVQINFFTYKYIIANKHIK